MLTEKWKTHTILNSKATNNWNYKQHYMHSRCGTVPILALVPRN